MRNFLNAIIGLPHGEERFGPRVRAMRGPRINSAEARLEPRTLPMHHNSCPASSLTRPTHLPGETHALCELHLIGLQEDGLPIPRPSSQIEYVEVAA